MSSKTETTSPKELPPAVNNSSLFTDYYLSELVKDDSFFQRSKEQANEVGQAIKAQYEKVKELLPTANEAETERRFIRPLLDILGYKDLYSLQPPVPSPEGVRRPDFAFFASEQDLEEAEKHLKGKQEYFTKAVAVGDAKQWERSLDKKIKGPGDPFTNQNPNYQIDFYLRMTDKTWGIVTNGRYWRLYHRDTSYRMNVFYEVDLLGMLEEYSDSFLYFYAFFCREALTSGFLDRAYHESKQYVAKLGDELKENVYEALRLLAEGFLKFPENGLSEPNLEEIRANTFVLIYRLLFLFYAEDRRLLPLEDPNYRSYSLRELAREVAERLDHGYAFSPAARGYWAKLQDLFHIVNEGDDLLGVPPYNGGLFDENKHPFLAQYKVGDLYLAKAIDRLARTEASGRTGRGPVSYRDPGVRHIGAIYEGLLEHHLRVADQEIAVVKEKGREKFIPIAKLNGRKPLKTYRAGEVYLETDKGERKATGSYYTPHYIVQYIVQNTLGPLVEEKRKEIQRAKQELEEKVKQSRGYNREAYERQLHAIGNRLIDEIRSIKVLDPAMGSGHFLVEATDFLARELIRALGESPKEVEEEEIRWARREVVERCIFGVDLNPLAVELAKLSLWLYTVAKDRPLSFLNHHLRLGNSLIGARMKDLGTLPSLKKRKKVETSGRISFFESELKKKLPVVIGQVVKLLQTPSDNVKQIREKERIYDKIREILRPFKEVANVWTSVYFGNEVKPGDYEQKLLLKLSDPPAVWESEVRSQPWFAKAQEIAREKHFFHWELEFPDVFYRETGQRKENPGFDVVIGNPPYVRQEQIGPNKHFFQSQYNAYHGVADLYVYFIEQGLRLLRKRGQFGFIVSNKFMRANYGGPLRQLLIAQSRLRQIIDFGELPVFPEAAAFPAIVLFEKGIPKDGQAVEVAWMKTLEFHDFESTIKSLAYIASDLSLAPEGWSLAEADLTDLLRKMEQIAVSLGQYVNWQIYRGVTTGLNEAFSIDWATYKRLIDIDPTNRELIKPLIVGDDVRRYEIEYRDKYLIFSRRGVDIERYPAIKCYLEQFRERLEPRPPGHTGSWPGRKSGSYQWYEIQDTTEYWLLFEQPKIVYPDIAKEARFAFDPGRSYPINTVYIIPRKDYYLLTLLNSRLLFFCMQHKGAVLGDPEARGRLRFIDQYMEQLPIRRIAFTTPKKERARLVEEGKRLYFEALERLGLKEENDG